MSNPAGRPRRPLAHRLWSRLDKSGGCWVWTGGVSKGGYGKIQAGLTPTGGPTLLAHRVAWELTHGPIPARLFVLHNCPGRDNPACCNPAHLWLGTLADNAADMVAKGRSAHPIGELHGQALLTEQQVRDIRLRHRNGETIADLGRAYGLKYGTVWAAVRRLTWRHVP